MSARLDAKRIAITVFAIAMIGGAVAWVFDRFTRTEPLSFTESLWIRKDGRFFGPASPETKQFLQDFAPYIDADHKTFDGPVYIDLDALSSRESHQRVVVLPLKDPPAD